MKKLKKRRGTNFNMIPMVFVGAGLEMVIQKHLNNDTFTVEEMSKFITDVLIKGLSNNE